MNKYVKIALVAVPIIGFLIWFYWPPKKEETVTESTDNKDARINIISDDFHNKTVKIVFRYGAKSAPITLTPSINTLDAPLTDGYEYSMRTVRQSDPEVEITTIEFLKDGNKIDRFLTVDWIAGTIEGVK